MNFHRTYLSQQVADRLANELRTGAWQTHLPGERALAAYFNVSRRTIRAALNILARTGVFRCVKRRRILAASLKRRPVKSGRKTAVLIASSKANILPDNFRSIQRLEHYFTLSGYTLQIEVMPLRVNLRRWLALVYKEHPASVWLLCSVAKEVQHWFEQRNLPALIIGSRHEGIHLPDIDIDYRAVCRHAAHTLLRLGHRRIIFLNIDFGFAGDLDGERGFSEAFSAFAPGTVTARVVRHKGSASQISRLLDRLFSGREAPTAMIVSLPCYAVTAVGHLLRIGKRIPADVSVICRDDHQMFEYFVPSLACYRVDINRFSRRAAQLAIEIDQGVFPQPTSLRFMPQFITGNSMASVRERH